MTDFRRAGRSRRETGPETGPETGRALADAAAELLDRLRSEPLPVGERTAGALRQATRHAFVLVEETRKLAAADTSARIVPFPGAQKNIVDRPVFFNRDEPAAAWADLDLETYRQRVGRMAARTRKRT